jgi:sporulation integral membrane protein YtvI
VLSVKTWPPRAQKALAIAAALAALFIIFRWLLPVFLPFAMALGLARVMEPAVQYLRKRRRIPRKVSSAVFTVLFVALFLAVCWLILTRLFVEIVEIIERVPSLIERLPEIFENLTARADRWMDAAPPPLRQPLRSAWEGALEGLSAVPASVAVRLTGWLAVFAGKLPYILLFVFALILSTFLISADYPNIIRFLLKPFGETARNRILSVKSQVVNTLGKWLKAQLLLMLITFGLLLTGFLILRIPAALLPALLIALVDALPVLGAGICLVPWAIGCFIAGSAFRGTGLLIIFCAVFILRGFIEPKLIGSHIGLKALPTFIAMYAGFVVAGVLGMLVFPILLITALQVWNAGGGSAKN